MKSLKTAVGIIALFAVIVITVLVVVFGDKERNKIQTDYEMEITSLAKDYYRNNYYDYIADPLVVLQEVSNTGIVFTLDTLISYKELTSKT